MKKHKMKPVAFVLTLALIAPCFLPSGATYGASIEEASVLPVEFRDISGHWGEDSIKDAVSAGFVQGYSDETFRPNKAVTRAEFVTMVNKALQLRDENMVNLLFQDVKETDWYYNDIQKASYARYVRGVSDTSFMPGKNITRQEASVMLAGFLPVEGYESETSLNAYPDTAKISIWAKNAMAVVINKGYLTGYANGNLAPKDTLTRAEAAKIIGKILDKETIVREDVSVKGTGEILKDKIYVGNITIEKSVGEGEATLDNLSALSKVYVKGGGTNTVTIRDSTIIQLIVCKEGTKVRVLSGDSTIYEAFLFNDNLLVNEQGQSAQAGENGYENIIYLNGTVSAEIAVKIASEIANRIDNTGKITHTQVAEGIAAVVPGSTTSENGDGSINVTLPSTSKTGRSSHTAPDAPLIVNNQTATLSAISGNTCSCGLSLTSGGAFTSIVEFDEDGAAGGNTVTGFAIYTETQLQHLAMHLNENGVLMNNLDFSGIATGAGIGTPMGALKSADDAGLYTRGHTISNFMNGKFVPIGCYIDNFTRYPYTGTFLGNGKTITGLVVSGSTSNSVGLFGYTSGAAIKDLTLSGGAITGWNYVGSIVGWNYNGTISACYNTASVSGTESVGGVAGINDFGTISACYNTGSVSGVFSTGGVVGAFYFGTISACYNTGAVSDEDIVGGVAGYILYGTISACYNTGAVSGTDYVGGVAAYNESGTVSNSHNTGAVSGINDVGGVAGFNISGTINVCYNTGVVSGSERVGGVAGYNDSGTVSNSYNMGAVSGDSNVGGVAGESLLVVTNCDWLMGTNLNGGEGVGSGSDTTGTFTTSASIISVIYSSMSAIATSASGDGIGAVTNITFGGISVIPTTFSALQGSYILSGNPTFTVYAVSDDVRIAVSTGTSLETLLTQDADPVTPQSSDGYIYAYAISDLPTGTWILIDASDLENPELNRKYIIYKL